MKKITLATIKKILKEKTCYIKTNSSFDWMNDSVILLNKEFTLIDKSKIDFNKQYSYWIDWFWITSKNRFEVNNNEIEVSNCCGSFIIKYI